MTRSQQKIARRLNSAIFHALKNFLPPENLTVSEWADKYRWLSRESSAEPGLWRTKRTPYLKEVMDAFNDPKVRRIVFVSASQVGKSEVILNAIAYIIDQDPGSILFVQPTIDNAKKFSRLRVAPMIRDCKRLKRKVADVKAKDSGNTILQKAFMGGMLTMTGANTAADLASTPVRYLFGDERDRWGYSAGDEGDPWKLAEARQRTFKNAKSVEVSTPTIKGASNIERSFLLGTQERWCHKCPGCGEWENIVFSDIRFEYESKLINHKQTHTAKSIIWACPDCGCAFSEEQMRRQEAKWIAANTDAYKKGTRSFWLNAFSSPWVSWAEIIEEFLNSKDDPQELQVVYNTMFGELWEDRGEIADEDTLLARREDYGEAELPDGVLMLTCGVDVQQNRLEYEIVGYGHFNETWGIRKGFIVGRPDFPEVWERLDEIIDHVYRFKNGKGIKITMTGVDSGYLATEVREYCRSRFYKGVYAFKGQGGDVEYVRPPTKVAVGENKNIKCWQYMIGVNEGKSRIMNALRVQEKGAGYCHFPIDPDRGYDMSYFRGLLSERPVLEGKRFVWKKLAGHERNEPLDLRNYANAAFKIAHRDLDEIERQLKADGRKAIERPARRTVKRSSYLDNYEGL